MMRRASSPRLFLMSDDTPPAPGDTSGESSAAPKPRARRISNPRPKKSPVKTADAATAKASAAFPAFDGDEAAPAQAVDSPAEASVPANDWPEPETISAESAASPANPKRKRRRKKGKGGGQGNGSTATADETASPGPEAAETQRPAAQAPRPKHDSEALAKLACKIYLAEVSEEGVALIGDNDARELSRRCFRLAEIFLDEQARRR